MRRNSFIFNFNQWPLSFLLMILLFLLTEMASRPFARYVYSMADEVIFYKKKLLQEQSRRDVRLDGLIMGDSRLLGVDAKILSDKISQSQGQSVTFFNYALPLNDVRGHYLWLKKYLSINQAPRYIVFGTVQSVFSDQWDMVARDQELSSELHRFYLLFSLKEIKQVVPLKFFIRSVFRKAERVSFLITYRRQIRWALQNIKELRGKKPISFYMKHRNGGIFFGDGSPPDSEQIKTSFWYRSRFSLDQESFYWYRRFLILAGEFNIRVIIVNAPLMDMVYNKRQETGDNLKYVALFDRIEKEFSHVTVLRPVFESYEREYFKDGHHLNGKGFRKYTVSLAQRLEKLIKSLERPEARKALRRDSAFDRQLVLAYK